MPAYGMLGQMMINVGVNLGPLGKGLAAARGQLSSFGQIGSQVAGGMTKSFGQTALSIAAVTAAIYGIQQAFAGAINAADEMRLATINIAATMTDWLVGGKAERRAAFSDHLVYAQEMYKVLELEAVKHFASGKDLQLAWTILTQKGVQLRYEEVNALGMVVDKIKLATQGQISTIQIAQEIRSLLNGQARTTDQIALLLKDKYGKAWKEIVNDHRKAGDLLQWLAEEWEGLASAQEHVLNTLEAQSTTLWTMVRRVGREGLAGAYQYIVDVLKDINEYLFEHELEISQGIKSAWISVEPAITAVGQAIQSLLAYLWENGEAIAGISRTIGDVIVWIVEVVQATASWIAANRELAFTVLSVIMAYKGAVILGTIITSLQTALAAATAGANALAVAMGYASVAAMGLSACIPIIGAIAAVIYLATSAAQGLASNLDRVLEKQRKIQYGESRLSEEEVEKQFESTLSKSPTAMMRLESEGIKPATVKDKQAVDQAIAQVTKLDIAIENLKNQQQQQTKAGAEQNAQWGPYGDNLDAAAKATAKLQEVQKQRSDAFIKAEEEAGKRGLHIYEDKEGIIRRTSNYEMKQLQLKGEIENKEFYDYMKKYGYQQRPDEEEKAKKGKGPQKLSEWPAIKAERDAVLQALKNELNEVEKTNELELASNENKYEQGIISGTQYSQAIIDMGEKVYQAKVKIINEEKDAENEAYQFRLKNIENEVSRGALTVEKAKIEQRKALAEHTKVLAVREKEMFDAGIEKTKTFVEVTKELITARKTLVDLAASMFQKITGGPLTEERKQLLAVRLEFVELGKQIEKLKINTAGKLEVDPALQRSAEYMIEAGKLLNADWAEPLSKAVEELAEARSGAAADIAKQKVRDILPDIQKTVEFDIKYKAQIDAYVSSISNGISSIVDALIDGGQDIRKAFNNMFRAIFKDSLLSSTNAMKEALTSGFKKLFGTSEKIGEKTRKPEIDPLKVSKETGIQTGVAVKEAVQPHLGVLQSMDGTLARIEAKTGVGSEKSVVPGIEGTEGFTPGMKNVLGTDYSKMSDEDFLKATGESPLFGTGGSEEFAGELLDIGADSGMEFGELAKIGMEEGAQSSGGIFNEIFGGIFKSLSSIFGGGGGGGGAFGNAIMGAVGIIGMVLSSSKGSKSFTPSGVTSNVTSTEPVRGIIAGPTSIPIAEISVSIREAFAASENYLSQIANNTRNIGSIGGGGGGGTYAPTFNISMELSVLKDAIANAMEYYFKNYLITEAGK